jgi:hypothetical protein
MTEPQRIRKAARSVTDVWAVAFPDLHKQLAGRPEFQRVNTAMLGLREALTTLDADTRNDRSAVVRERIAELDSTPQWVAKFPRLEGEPAE